VRCPWAGIESIHSFGQDTVIEHGKVLHRLNV
jgi:hypothetical protein